MVGAWGSAVPLTVWFSDGSKPPWLAPSMLMSPAKLQVRVDLGVEPARQRDGDLAGVQAHGDLAAVQGLEVAHTGEVQGDLAVGHGVDVVDGGGPQRRHGPGLAARLPVGRRLDPAGDTQAQAAQDAQGDQASGPSDERTDQEHRRGDGEGQGDVRRGVHRAVDVEDPEQPEADGDQGQGRPEEHQAGAAGPRRGDVRRAGGRHPRGRGPGGVGSGGAVARSGVPAGAVGCRVECR